MSFAGLFFAFLKGWWFSLLLLAAFPVLMIMTSGMSKAMQSGFMTNLKSYGQSAGYAEQALNAIRVVQAFGQEKTEEANYEKYLGRAKAAGVKTHVSTSISIGLFIFGMFGYYAYAFYVGSILVLDGIENSNTGKPYNGGDIMACFFGVVFGVFAIGMATPNIKAVVEGQVAGKLAYDLINRVPKIQTDDPSAKKLGSLNGRIEFKNVSFSYPSRPEQKVLNNFSASF